MLRGLVADYHGYRYEGFAPGVHLGMPSPQLTVVVTLGPDIGFAGTPVPAQAGSRFAALASGIAEAPVEIVHDGTQYGMQLTFTPWGARALFGIPAGALGPWLVDLGEVLGADARELRDRAAAAATWPERFAVLDDVLVRRLRPVDVAPELREAWRALVTNPRARVGDVAGRVGWSRRTLSSRFTAEFAVTPKTASRLARFARSHRLARGEAPLAEIAVRCGYADQAHLDREWRDLAGVSPTRWRRDEVFPFVQDDDHHVERDFES
ncbi:transcriptional regulator [Rhodococcus rhodnii LMG 5362]|uniref:Transcriptional regulator n=1 Tax=Rhodococcus rhodnii LMG 5362 TaxID=1273125 RepID=R7WPX3_9NOCA|nr:transcriptional regulator [Rhodococcus rhodnii LMG 5362]